MNLQNPPELIDSIESRNPANPNEHLGTVAVTQADEVQATVERAQEAQPSWAASTASARHDFLMKWAAVIEQEKAEIASLICKEVGKPIGEAIGETARASAILRFFAGECIRESGQLIPSAVSKSLQMKIEKPLGVVGLITPWNFPIAIPLWKAAPALAFGNSVVIKPSELSSMVAKKLQELAAAAGIPNGVYQTIYGAGRTGQELLNSPIHAISFTGSAAAGKKVIEAASTHQMRCQAEMGGKNPSIVLSDANLDLAATMIAGAAMRYAGQKCTATSRVIVERSVSHTFLPKLIAAVEVLTVGDPSEPSTAVGPVISEASQARIDSFLQQNPAEALYKGVQPQTGWYVAPLILRCLEAKSPLAQTELFGPILSYLEVETPEEAIEVANHVPYGLSASLFSSNIHRAMSYVERIEAGMIRVNADTTGVDPYSPFGGVKKSSYGPREQGPAARQFYTESATVQINY